MKSIPNAGGIQPNRKNAGGQMMLKQEERRGPDDAEG